MSGVHNSIPHMYRLTVPLIYIKADASYAALPGHVLGAVQSDGTAWCSLSRSLSFSHVTTIRQHSFISRLHFIRLSHSSIFHLRDCALDKKIEGGGGNQRLSSRQSFLTLRLMPPLLPVFVHCGRTGWWWWWLGGIPVEW